MTDPNNPLNLLLTLETALRKSHKGRWPNNVRNAVQGLRRALAARFETPAGPVYGSIDACASVQRKFGWSAPIETEYESKVTPPGICCRCKQRISDGHLPGCPATL